MNGLICVIIHVLFFPGELYPIIPPSSESNSQPNINPPWRSIVTLIWCNLPTAAQPSQSNMKIVAALCLVVLAAIATNVAAYPVLEEEAPLQTSLFDVDAELAPFEEEQGVRMRRLTCDLLSFQSKWVTPNHSACAAHCLALRRGFKGGRCQNGVCHCRK